MKRFAMGDPHGRIEAVLEVLKASGFDYEKDELIVLGDVVDGGENTFEVVEEFLKIKNLVFIQGNHDQFFIDYLLSGRAVHGWVAQGGIETINSYLRAAKKGEVSYRKPYDWQQRYGETAIVLNDFSIPASHKEFFANGVNYYEVGGMLFVHGGFDVRKGVENTLKCDLQWDRTLIEHAKKKVIESHSKVFIGHTTTQRINNSTDPAKLNNLFCLDCGAGWNGRLCLMNVDTEEHWLSQLQEPSGR